MGHARAGRGRGRGRVTMRKWWRGEWKESHVRIRMSMPSGTAPCHNANPGNTQQNWIIKQRKDAPREFLSPLDVNSGDVCPTLFPLGFPNLAAIERGTVEVRASERVELRFGKVQRRPELAGRRERIEIRRMDERVVAIRECRA